MNDDTVAVLRREVQSMKKRLEQEVKKCQEVERERDHFKQLLLQHNLLDPNESSSKPSTNSSTKPSLLIPSSLNNEVPSNKSKKKASYASVSKSNTNPQYKNSITANSPNGNRTSTTPLSRKKNPTASEKSNTEATNVSDNSSDNCESDREEQRQRVATKLREAAMSRNIELLSQAIEEAERMGLTFEASQGKRMLNKLAQK